MINFKKITALLASGILCATALVGCGGGESFFKGKWVGVEMTSDGKTLTAEEYEKENGSKLEDNIAFEFKDDNKVVVNWGGAEGETKEGTWKLDGDNVTVEVDGDSSTLRKDGDNVIFEPADSVSVKLEKK